MRSIKVLGVKEVRRYLLDELHVLISFGCSFVNYWHLTILCDTMTYWRHLIEITRDGSNEDDRCPFFRSSFEEATNNLIGSAVYVERDYLRSVTDYTVPGQHAPTCTVGCSIAMDLLVPEVSVNVNSPPSPPIIVSLSPSPFYVDNCLDLRRR